LVALATAHPAKFPDAVELATGERPALPPHLSDLFEREERLVLLPNDLTAVETYIRGDNTRGTEEPTVSAQGRIAS
jgi:threonine synthase